MPIQKNWRISYHDSIADEDAIYPYLAGIIIYDDPLVGFASADDELFGTEFKKEGVIHSEYLAPLEWLHARISPYISTWSERHAAYAAGLGTFGLSKGLKFPSYGPNQRVRYGCGKCQCGVPCASGIPKR